MFRNYLRAIICVLIGYIMTFLGYLPWLEIHESSIVSIVVQMLEIGCYKPIFIISTVLMITDEAVRMNKKDTALRKALFVERICIRCGACSFAGFLLFFLPLLFFFPVITAEEIESMADGYLHFRVYAAGNPALIILFHGTLLFGSGIIVSSLYMISFYRSRDSIRSFLFTLVTYQSITFIQSMINIPNCWKIDSLSSGWFQNPFVTDNYISDMIWCLLVVFAVSFVINTVSVAVDRKKDGF